MILSLTMGSLNEAILDQVDPIMMRSNEFQVLRKLSLLLTTALLVTVCQACHGNDESPTELAGLEGGLIVQLGASDTQSAAKLSRTGRYLIHVLDQDPKTVLAAQQRLHQQGRYGLAWA